MSSRDYDDFKDVFNYIGVQHNVFYGTIEELSEQLINRRGNIRESVVNVISSNKAPVRKAEKELRPSVLFIDEVDVFFEK